MEVQPLQYVPQCPLGEISVHYAVLDLHGNLVFPVDRVEVRRRVFTRENTDDNPEESRKLRHTANLRRKSGVFNGPSNPIEVPHLGLLAAGGGLW